MKKTFYILIPVVAVLVAAFYFLLPPKSYADVSMTNKNWDQIQTSKKNIDAVLSDLQAYTKAHEEANNKKSKKVDKAFNKLKKSVTKMVSENGRNLSPSEFQELKNAADIKNGLLKTVDGSYKNNYAIDDELSSTFHINFEQIILASAKSATENDVNAQKVANKLTKDLNVDSRIYSMVKRD